MKNRIKIKKAIKKLKKIREKKDNNLKHKVFRNLLLLK